MNIIRRKRKELGISQKELSEKLGTSQQTISRIEKADIENIPCSLLVKLANIFDIPIDVLVYGDNSDLCKSQIEELWDVFQKLDEINKATLLLMGRRLNEAQMENMLKNYTGTILFVSHDRYFIKEIATGMLDFKQDKTVFYDCGYEEYLERLQKEELKQQQLLQARQEEERKEKKPEGSGNKTPTLSDVFDKKTYYNPGKILSRLKQQMAKYEKQLEESEQRLADLQMQIMDPALASDYTKLMELEEQRQKEEQNQESLLERMLETETELEEMQQQ